MSSANKDAANRRNSTTSTGPSNTVSTLHNTAKHGLIAEGVTELHDRTAFERLWSNLEADHASQGELERFLVGRLALGTLRLGRSALMEAEYNNGGLNPPETCRVGERHDAGRLACLEGVLFFEGPRLPTRMTPDAADDLNSEFMRYEAGVENQLFRSFDERDRPQRSRTGGVVPPPSTSEIALPAPEPAMASFRSAGAEPNP